MREDSQVSIRKKIVLGVTGGIAAYKSVDLVRRFRDQAADVRVVMTEAACQLVSPTTFQAVSGHAVATSLWSAENSGGMDHIALAKWADLIIVAPATADFLAQLAHGFAGNLLSTLCIATAAPVWIAPAMNQQMYAHLAVQSNISVLKQRGVGIIGPDEGEQACGDVGLGRLSSVSDIVAAIYPKERVILQGKRILITAGATREPLDPIRYFTNRSTGQMGYALATVLQRLGAKVTLVSGVSNLPVPSGVAFHMVETAVEMNDSVQSLIVGHDVMIASAAVADYRPVVLSNTKIKKSAGNLSIDFCRNPDILQQVIDSGLCSFCVGFAAETDNVMSYAKEKLMKKSCQLLVVNQVGVDQGFGERVVPLTVMVDSGESVKLVGVSKLDLADQLVGVIAQRLSHTVAVPVE